MLAPRKDSRAGSGRSSVSSACCSSRTGRTPAPSTSACNWRTASCGRRRERSRKHPHATREPAATLTSVGQPSPPSLLVLHALRLKGFAKADVVSASTGLPTDAIETHLAELAAGELVARREGRISGWALTAAGREEHRRQLQRELEEHGLRDEILDAYRRFLSLNGELLSLCTAWQMRDDAKADPIMNNHRDAPYDAAVVERLDRVHEAVVPVCGELASALDRYGPYEPRLSTARDRVHAGEPEWLTRPLIDSYHTVWFELHEDLLATLGLERKEGET